MHVDGGIRPTTQNRLIAALPSAEAERWLPLLEPVDMPLGSVLYESGGTLSHVYFPDDIHHLSVVRDGKWGLRLKLPSLAMRALSAFPYSWVASPRRVERSYRVPAAAFDSKRAQ